MASRRDSKAPSAHPVAKIRLSASPKERASAAPKGRASVAPKGRASIAPKRPSSKRPIPRSEPPHSADEQIGRLLAHVAKLEKENAALRVGPSKEALATLKDGLDAMREMLLVAAADLDAFTRREFALADPKARTLVEVRTVLLKAAGHEGRPSPPPPAPRPKPRPMLDIAAMADTVESLRPAAPRDFPDVFVISPLPLPPKR